jgi:hypothetical protein
MPAVSKICFAACFSLAEAQIAPADNNKPTTKPSQHLDTSTRPTPAAIR